MEASELETGAVEDPMADPNATMEFAFGPDNLTLKDVQEKRKEAKVRSCIGGRKTSY